MWGGNWIEQGWFAWDERVGMWLDVRTAYEKMNHPLTVSNLIPAAFLFEPDRNIELDILVRAGINGQDFSCCLYLNPNSARCPFE